MCCNRSASFKMGYHLFYETLLQSSCPKEWIYSEHHFICWFKRRCCLFLFKEDRIQQWIQILCSDHTSHQNESSCQKMADIVQALILEHQRLRQSQTTRSIWKNWLQNQPNMKKRSAISRIWWMPLCENIIQKTITRMVQSKRENINGKPQNDVDV